MLIFLQVVTIALLFLTPAVWSEETAGGPSGSIEERFKGLENLVLLQGAEIETLKHKEKLVNQLEQLVKQQGGEIEILRHQEKLVNRLEQVVKQQGAEIEQLKIENLELRKSLNHQSTASSSSLDNVHQKVKLGGNPPEGESSRLEDHLLAFPFARKNGTTPNIPIVRQKQVHEMTSSRSSRALHARADDTDPLAPVVSQMAQRVTDMEAKVSALEAGVGDAGSSAYVRWGSSRCANDSQLVYSGVVGGSHYTSQGAAPNYLCLTMEPVMSDYHPAGDNVAHVYGAEYQTHDAHQDHDPVCAVCRSPRPTTIMVPGTNRCQAGWVQEYSGYLMANYRDHPGASDFVCVDESFEEKPGGTPNQNGKLFYFATYVCGSLPCGPYVNGKTVVCAVCSK